MKTSIYMVLCILFAGNFVCSEDGDSLQRLIDQLKELDGVNKRQMTDSTGSVPSLDTSDSYKRQQENADIRPQKSSQYENVLRELRRLVMINKRDHVIPAVDLSHFSCSQEYYGLRKLVDNLAKKYCVVKDDHVHDSLDGF
ncbi:uncharacterized protein LOC128182186 [Crassostrea angulata]|uniref:uncharacterized protein LOC128182186 n=1 Tax=Magallana angulata TaxID=2784310 RepID=UPI0022B09A8E|nr:uncharacterized protein LOC128182186 [Crassostrea angulata]